MTSTPSKATAGPWRIDGPKQMHISGRVHRIVDDDMYPVAFVPAWDMPDPGEIDGKEEALANAHLIAAGRDMLAALEAIVFQVAQGKVLERDACITQARAAISRAKGEA